jgi:hypothetical protein
MIDQGRIVAFPNKVPLYLLPRLWTSIGDSSILHFAYADFYFACVRVEDEVQFGKV